MRVLILMHDALEDAGTILEYLKRNQTDIRVVEFFKGASLPNDALQTDAVISMGGPMNVYEEDAYPFLKDETVFLARCFKQRVPVLGICLGAQMMAKAAGARVLKAPKEETGWYEISLTEAGRSDGFFMGLPKSFTVFQLHGDTFEVPSHGTLLATSPTCQNQAFRIGNSLGLQFHLEINDKKLAEWLVGHGLRDTVLDTYRKVRPDLERNAQILYRNFFGF